MNREPSPATTNSTSTPSGVEMVTRSSSSTGATLTARRGVDAFIADRTPAWTELVGLVGESKGRLDRLAPEKALRLGEGYRAAAADLARARQRWPGDPVVTELEDLVGRARTIVYRTPGGRTSLIRWLTTGFFQRVRESARLILVAALLLWGPAIGMAIWAHGDPATAAQVSQVSALSSGAADSAASGGPDHSGQTSLQRGALGTQIFVNNIRVSLLCLAGGLTGGLATAALLIYNGGIVGVIVGLFTASGGGDTVVSYLAPHGVLELSLVTVAGAAGLRIGRALVAPGHRPRTEALVIEARAAAEIALGAALWLIPTGLVEGFVTPLGLSPAPALAVGLSLGALFWGLVAWQGRPGSIRSGDELYPAQLVADHR